MRTTLLPKILLLTTLLLTACASPGKIPDPRQAQSQPQTPFINAHALIIIRHADIISAQKATLGNATPLTDAGQQRTKDLAAALSDANITHIVVDTALRIKETAAILADSRKIVPEVQNVRNISETIAYLAKIATPADTILVVEHHSNIPSLMEQLGYPKEPPLVDESEFDRFYLLLPDPKTQKYQLFRLRYGAPSSR